MDLNINTQDTALCTTSAIKSQQVCAQYNHTLSKLEPMNTVVPQSVSTIIEDLPSDVILPAKDVQIATYAADITTTASNTKHHKV